MTLDEIWENGRSDMTQVAVLGRTTGSSAYVSLAHKSAQEAFDNAEARQGLTPEDRVSADWSVRDAP